MAKFCSECGSALVGSGRFCAECGCAVPGAGSSTPQGAERQGSGQGDSAATNTSGHYDVILVKVGRRRAKVAAAISQTTSLTLVEARDLCTHVPALVVAQAPEREAQLLKAALEDLGAAVNLDSSGSTVWVPAAESSAVATKAPRKKRPPKEPATPTTTHSTQDAAADLVVFWGRSSAAWRAGIDPGQLSAAQWVAIIGSPDHRFSSFAASSPQTPPRVLRRLLWDDRPEVVVAAASNIATPPEAFDHLLDRNAKESIKQAVATNPGAPDRVLYALGKDASEGVRLAAWKTLGTPAAQREAKIRSAVGHDRSLADDIAPPPKEMAAPFDRNAWIDPEKEEDYQQPDETLRVDSSQIPIDVLARFAYEDDYVLRWLAAWHKRTPAEGLMFLVLKTNVSARNDFFQEYDGAILMSLGQRAGLPLAIQDELVFNPDPNARTSLAYNETADPTVLAALAHDAEYAYPDKDVPMRCAAHNRSTPEASLRRLAHVQDDQLPRGLYTWAESMREAVAGNPSCPREVLQELCRDQSDTVARAAQENLARRGRS